MTTSYTISGSATLINPAVKSPVLGLFSKKADDSGAKKLYKCEHCSMIFDDKERMKRHMKKAHRERGGDMPNRNPFGF
ncbi:MAG: hypothetical protein MN733_07540 [Nitrososphaera sp.]|nr:hypothetical protein [Nitrososphaera sp.]